MTQNVSGVLPMWHQWMQQSPAQYAPFNTVAGFTPMQQQAWGAGLQGASNIAGFGRNIANQYNQGPMMVGMSGMDMFNNPYLQDSIQAAIQQNNQNYQRNILPTLGSEFASQPGSTREGIAQGLAASDLNQQNLNMAAQMQNANYQNAMGHYLNQRGQNIGMAQGNQAAMLQQMGLAPNIFGAYSQSQMMPSQTMAGIGQMQQGMKPAQDLK